MVPNDSLDPVLEQLAAHPAWHVWVLEYSITHHQMVLALHPGTFPKTAKLHLLDCIHFCGDLQAGPFVFGLTRVDHHGDALWELRSEDSSFRVLFGTARLVQALPS